MRPVAVESLEERCLLTPTVIAVRPNVGEFLSEGEVRNEAPRELTIQFSPGQVIDEATLPDGIQVEASGLDGTFGDGNEVPIEPGFVGIGGVPNEAVVRFASTLPDEVYQVTVFGTGATPVMNTATPPETLNDGASDFTLTFELDLGAEVVAVVPQPVIRTGTTLDQADNQIVVYFNNDDLDPASAENTDFYQLINTQESLTAVGDTIQTPTDVVYDAAADTATLTFASIPAGTYKLRVGESDQPVENLVVHDLTRGDDDSSFATAEAVGVLRTDTVQIQAAIQAQNFLEYPAYPGGNDEPGHRHIPPEDHLNATDTTGSPDGQPADVSSAIQTIRYYFPEIYGEVLGNDVFNQISENENQKQRTREIFELYSRYTGIQFVEVSGTVLGDGDLGIVTGDPRAVDPTVPPGTAGGIAGVVFETAFPVALVDGSQNFGASLYGGSWFQIAMHEIGHSIGMGHSYDLPSILGPGLTSFSGNPIEPVFPGDHDITHLQRAHRPDSKDIDLYEFELTEAGYFTAEVIAERKVASSTLDSALLLFDSNQNVIAQNDDYFSNDSFLNLHLDAGTYFVGVSSTGNTQYDPVISNTGLNGRTHGDYELLLNFEGAATSTLVDSTGTEFDGDADGLPGGVFEFYFQSGTTAFVDKTAAAGTGAIDSPFNRIDAALTAAAGGGFDIVRIVGNDTGTPYLIGLDDGTNPVQDVSQNPPVAGDGATFEVPNGVTVMIDEGAILKMQSAIIEVGDVTEGVDRSGGALQLLGTPDNQVIITSYANDDIGGDNDGVTPPAMAGDFGGIVFRDNSDLEEVGVFLNHVQQADISFGGGTVTVNAVDSIFAPVHMETARPTLLYNTITNSAAEAISADPNSLEEGLGDGTEEAIRIGAMRGRRIGPDLRGNHLTDNTLNGLNLRVETLFGVPADTLDVTGRIDDLDVTHVVTTNLVITGTPGGALDENARLQGGLTIDAGTVVKVERSVIEAERGGGRLTAEGTADQRIIFTSLNDDRYGAGGTFDTGGNEDGTIPLPGDWGGLIFNSTSSGSIDYALITTGGGGDIPIAGGFATFNAIEVHQADFRLTNSVIEENADGFAGANRNGRGNNDRTTVFVRGAQPIIVGNVFRNNVGSVISVNANAMQSTNIPDYGRSTGLADTFEELVDNRGPLLRLNRYENNALNGVEIRGEELTAETTWDDDDIDHILRSEIYVDNHHTRSGLRLVSSQTSSLVVKLDGPNAGLTANGRAIDIDDRIGGTLQVIGNGSFPVIFTSLHDDTVGSGFDPAGFPIPDTNNNGGATSPGPGNWRSLRIDEFANDRNVRVMVEDEQAFTGGNDLNGIPADSEFLGTLARGEKAGDDNQPLGFEIFGFVGFDNPADRDVYSFKATPGTEVWFDLDRTGSTLDTTLELISFTGVVTASSIGGALSGLAQPLMKEEFLGDDLYTIRPQDEGFRAILPGTLGSEPLTYYIRVGSEGGLTSGEYELEIRLRQTDEKAGSTITFADIAYANNGIEVFGLPNHSPLLGEAYEANEAGNNTFGGAQPIGDLLVSDRNVLSVGGDIINPGDVDWYQFDAGYEFIQSIAGINAGGKTFSTIFDIDYADGLSRADLTLSVFDSNGNLILMARDSDIDDDQPADTSGSADDLSRGSFGKLDPFIGPVQLPVATPGGTETYFVAVSSNAELPDALDQYFFANATNPFIRLEPVDSIQRVAEDHIGFTDAFGNPFGGYWSGSGLLGVNEVRSTAGVLFDITNHVTLAANVVPFTLSDVTLFSTNGTDFFTFDAQNGSEEINNFAGNALGNQPFQDIEFRSDGVLFGYRNDAIGNTDDRLGVLEIIDPSSGARTQVGFDSIPNFDPGTAPPDPNQITGTTVNAMAWRENGPTAQRPWDLFYTVPDTDGASSRLYRADPANGSAAVAQGQPWGRVGGFDTISGNGVIGQTTGLEFIGGTLFGVSDGGQFYEISTTGAQPTLLQDFSTQGFSFVALTKGPRNVEGGAFADILFAVTTTGTVVAINTDGNPETIFDGVNQTQELSINGSPIAPSFFQLTFDGLSGSQLTTLPISFDAPTNIDQSEIQTVSTAGSTSGDFTLTFAGETPFRTTSEFAIPNAAAGTAGVIPVANSTGFPPTPFNVRIGTEELQVTGVLGSDLNVVRGVNGTTPSLHSLGAVIEEVLVLPGTTLAAPVDDVATTISVADPGVFPALAPFNLTIDSEDLIVEAIIGNNFTVRRGVNGTTAAAHAVDSGVTEAIAQTTRPLAFNAPGSGGANRRERITLNGPPSDGTFVITFDDGNGNVEMTRDIAFDAPTTTSLNEIFTIQPNSTVLGGVTGGTFTLEVPIDPADPTMTAVTGNIDFDANSAEIEAAIEAVPGFPFMSVSVFPTVPAQDNISLQPISIEFVGSFRTLDVADVVVDTANITGGGFINGAVTQEASVSVQEALDELTNTVAGDLQVTGGPLPGVPILITYAGQFSGLDTPTITVDDTNLFGGTASVSLVSPALLSIQEALERLTNIDPGEIVVSNGLVNGVPINVEFVGRFAGLDLPEMIIDISNTQAGDVNESQKGKISLRTALEGLSTIDPLDITLNGGDLPTTPVQIVFGGKYTALNLPNIVPINDMMTNGSTAVIAGLGATGGSFALQGTTAGSALTFTPLDFNLWHPTMKRSSDRGHGVNNTPNGTRTGDVAFTIVDGQGDGRATSQTQGGASFYFGIEEWVNDPENDEYLTYQASQAQLGILSNNTQRFLTDDGINTPFGTNIGDNYNLPGGAYGSLITNEFSLDTYDAIDKPTFYFNYFLETENAAGSRTNTFRDAARVFITDDDGATWTLLATNNSALSTAALNDAELPTHLAASDLLALQRDNTQVQELFDNTGTWRQARVDLARWAGESNLKVRFDFTTAGITQDQFDTPSDFGFQSGNFQHRNTSSNNDFEGFYVDDIIIGFTERGEIATDANANETSFFTTPPNPIFGDPQESLVGEYQLEIRRGTEYVGTLEFPGLIPPVTTGDPLSGLLPDVAISDQFDTDGRFIPDFTQPGVITQEIGQLPGSFGTGTVGDQNVFREQGQLIIDSNTVNHAANFGILIDAGARTNPGDLSHPGPVRNLPTLNNDRLAPGVTARNNIVANFANAGIVFRGDDNSGPGGIASVPFGRGVNNTIYGGATAGGTGILVQDASPTLLNQVIVNTALGIDTSNANATVVVGSTLFQGNTADGVTGTSPVFLAVGDPLFVDPANDNFYLASGSFAIDSSLDTLPDRPQIEAVRTNVGIPTSEVRAPDLDRFGQMRDDDTTQDPPPGVGGDPFKDRGAVERADFDGPFARLTVPEDNGLEDFEPAISIAALGSDDLVTEFVVQLLDNGIGIDDLTANTASQYIFTQDGEELVDGVDYIFVYNPATNEAIFRALTTFEIEKKYTIELSRGTIIDPDTGEVDPATGIRDLAGNLIQANRIDGTHLYEISLTDGVNDPPANSVPGPQVTMEDIGLIFSAANGNAITISDPDAALGDNIVRVTLATETATTTQTSHLTIPDTTGLTFIVGDGSEDAAMTFTGSIPDINAALDGLIYDPTDNSSDPGKITITTNDRGNFTIPAAAAQEDTDEIDITITPVNDGPTFTLNLDPVISDEDDGVFTVPNFATDLSVGPADEEAAGQTLSAFNLVLQNTTGNLAFIAGPIIDLTTGSLIYESASQTNGTTDVVVTLVDSEGAASDPQVFQIVVNAMNDAPEFVLTDPPAIPEGAGPQTVSDTATNIMPGPAAATDEVGQAVTFTLTPTGTVGSLTFEGAGPMIDADGQLTYEATPGTAGTATFNVVAVDDVLPVGEMSAPQVLTITVNAGFTVTPTNLVVDEAGTTTADFTVVLDAEPVSPVTIGVAVVDGSEAKTEPEVTELIFTAANWDTPQTVRVQGVDDLILDGDQTTPVTLSVAAGSDGVFAGLADQTVNVTTLDDEVANFVLSATEVTVSEDLTLATFDVSLVAEPLGNVVINLSDPDASEAEIDLKHAHLHAGDLERSANGDGDGSQ